MCSRNWKQATIADTEKLEKKTQMSLEKKAWGLVLIWDEIKNDVGATEWSEEEEAVQIGVLRWFQVSKVKESFKLTTFQQVSNCLNRLLPLQFNVLTPTLLETLAFLAGAALDGMLPELT